MTRYNYEAERKKIISSIKAYQKIAFITEEKKLFAAAQNEFITFLSDLPIENLSNGTCTVADIIKIHRYIYPTGTLNLCKNNSAGLHIAVAGCTQEVGFNNECPQTSCKKNKTVKTCENRLLISAYIVVTANHLNEQLKLRPKANTVNVVIPKKLIPAVEGYPNEYGMFIYDEKLPFPGIALSRLPTLMEISQSLTESYLLAAIKGNQQRYYELLATVDKENEP